MSTVLICWGEGENKPAPLGTVQPDPSGNRGIVRRAKIWCKEQADLYAERELPEIRWQQYLSRGISPGSSHYVGKTEIGTFEIWIIGEIEME